MEKKEMIFGTRAVMEAIHAGKEIEKIFVQAGLNNDLIKELIALAKSKRVQLSFTPQQKLDRLSSKNHQGVICLLSVVQYANLDNLISKAYEEGRDPFFLILDRITDVRNFGAIVRSAECAGLDGIIIPNKGNAPLTADAMKTSAGALNHLPICREFDLSRTIRRLKENGIQVIACTEKAEKTLYETNLSGPVAVILGSEEDGISNQLIKDADYLARIPMRGNIASLNVSVSAGIALFEVIRQKNYK
ncbi:MAG: 23S rRNA (guanosine(2251)-2'-O)-methyltransferase RlmB [Cyclobacteriaceae bacterium]